jgi:N5-(cytidine 5'-diphosphoramidyl)-L-glutamine hydrolase
MKKIAITQRLVENTLYKETREALDVNYARLISEAGCLPIVLPYKVSFVEYFQELNISGVLLTGGNDLNSVNPGPLSHQRDKFEKELISYAIDDNIPIFGICRGMQVIAEYFGSTFKRVSGQVNTHHALKPSHDSLYLKQLDTIGTVNSFHNFSVDSLGDELKVSAMGSDIIKAIEHKKYRILAQMWHSERELNFNKQEVMLIKDFFNGVIK